MKLKNLFVSIIAAAILVPTGCVKEDAISTLDGFEAESTYAIVPEGTSSKSYTFTTDQAWTVTVSEKAAEWLSVSPTSGSAGNVTVTINVTEAESTREGEFYIVMGDKTQTVRVKQVAAEVEPEILTVTEAVSRIKAGTQGEKNVYVRGIVCRIQEISPSYGNATYYLSDDGTYGTDNWLQVYRGKWIDGANFTKGDEFAVGDEMVISGVLIYYNNTTPETSQGTCSVISVKKSLVSVEPTEVKMDAAGGIADVTVVVKDGTLKFSTDSDWISVSGMESVDGSTIVHLKVDENTAYEKRSGTITFTASTASASSSVSVTVSQAAAEDPSASAVYARATSIVSGKTYVIVSGNNIAKNIPADKNYGYFKKGEDVTVTELGTINSEHTDCEFVFTEVDGGYTIRQADGRYVFQTGTYDSFNVNAAPESGHIWSVSVDSSTGRATITNASTGKFIQWDSSYSSYGCYADAKGELPVLYVKNDLSDGTLEHPFTVSKAIEKCQALDSGESTEEWYYVKGIFVRWNKESDAFGANTYGNASFWMSEDGVNYGDKTKEFEAYRVKWFGNVEWKEGNGTISEGDEVVLYCQLKNFNGTSENNAGYVYSVNGKTSDE